MHEKIMRARSTLDWSQSKIFLVTIRHKTNCLTHQRCCLAPNQWCHRCHEQPKITWANRILINFDEILIEYYARVLWNGMFQSPGYSGNHAAPSAKILKAAGHLQSWIMCTEQASINRLILTLYIRFVARQSAIL